MKKILVFLTALIVVSFFTPVSGQCQIFNKKKKAKTADTAKTTIQVLDTAGNPVVIEVEDPQFPTKTPTTKKNANMTLADVIARLEKLEQKQAKAEKSLSSLTKELKTGKKSILDSILEIRNEARKAQATLRIDIDTASDQLKRELANNANFMADLEEKVDSGDLVAAKTYTELKKLQGRSILVTGASIAGFALLMALIFYLWRQKTKMSATLNRIRNEMDPDHLSFRGNNSGNES